MAKTLDAAGVKRLIQEIKGANKNLNAPIPISTENTTESKAQNVKNIADYVEKAKAAGMADVNGMAVTCLIDGSYSGVGYLCGDTDTTICGIETFDDSSNPMYFRVDLDGTYREVQIIMENSVNIVTSDMLVEGARKPIILTPETTEVDEETYQKLLSDDVDVVFYDEGWYIPITIKDTNDPDSISLDFSLTSFDGSAPDTFDTVMKDVSIRIAKNSPHNVTFPYNASSDLDTILQTSGYLNKSTLTPVLQEIDLTGTDAERKAKLDQFETDWKALTGASDLTGARFVGITSNEYVGVFTWSQPEVSFVAVATYAHSPATIYLDRYSGQLTEVPLSSHLEPVEIFDDNSIESKKKNIDNIEAYKSNLEKLGVDTSISFQVPIYRKSNSGVEESGFLIYSNLPGVYKPYSGLFLGVDGTSFNIFGISSTGEFIEQTYYLADINYSSLTTTSKQIVPAINEVNALAKGNAKSLEAITIKIGSTPENKAANKAVIEAYRDNLTALGVDVTKGFMIPVKTDNGNGFILFDGTKGSGYVKVNNDCYGISIEEDYGCSPINIMSTSTSYGTLNTTSKRVLPAINEVNALAKGYSTPIELTTETAQNKTAIDARVAAFTAQGISLTNGCCIPVTYKGVYAGNISLINGDWYGLLVKNTNNPADNINIKLSADGTITEGNSAQ